MNSPSTVLHRYEQVAEHVRFLIHSGTYSAQQKLPSVRTLSQQLQVSVTTVLEAYRTLEDQGVVEARPQSGYYVSPPPQAPPMSHLPAPENPIDVGMGDFLVRHLRDFQRPDLVQFGSACAAPEGLPTARLGRLMARMAKEYGGNSYDLPPGCEALRVQIARRALQAGCVVSPEEVLLTLGCQEALNLCLRAVCQPGDTVAVESPTFYGHLQAIETLGLKVLELPSDPVSGISLPALRQTLEEVSVKAVLLSTTYSNPTGSTLSEADKEELVEILARHDVPLIEDDIFGELCHSGQRPRAARHFDRRDLVLLCSSFSKTIAPGYRVGWVLAGPRYMSRLQQLKVFSNLASPLLPALTISEFLATGGYDHHLRLWRREYAARVHQMGEVVLRSFPPGTKVSRPRGGYVLWVELPGQLDTGKYYPLALQAGLTFAPGPIFSARARFRNCLRLRASYFTPATEPVLARLGQLFRA